MGLCGVVRAGFEGDVGGCACDRVAFCGCVVQGHDFGVWTAAMLGVALSKKCAIGCGENAAHSRVGRTDAKGLTRIFERH